LSPDEFEAPAGACTTGASGVYICAAATDSNPPISGHHSRPRGLFLFLPRHNRAREGQARCLRPFNGTNSKNFTFSPRCRSGLKSADANRAAIARALNEVLANSCMPAFVTGIVVLVCRNVHQLSERRPHREMDLGLPARSAPFGLGVLIALGGIPVMMS
jgi:hypothetical protein